MKFEDYLNLMLNLSESSQEEVKNTFCRELSKTFYATEESLTLLRQEILDGASIDDYCLVSVGNIFTYYKGSSLDVLRYNKPILNKVIDFEQVNVIPKDSVIHISEEFMTSLVNNSEVSCPYIQFVDSSENYELTNRLGSDGNFYQFLGSSNKLEELFSFFMAKPLEQIEVDTKNKSTDTKAQPERGSKANFEFYRDNYPSNARLYRFKDKICSIRDIANLKGISRRQATKLCNQGEFGQEVLGLTLTEV